MDKKSFIAWKKVWLENYILHYKKSNYNEKKVIKKEIYENINLTEKQKDEVWSRLVECGQ